MQSQNIDATCAGEQSIESGTSLMAGGATQVFFKHELWRTGIESSDNFCFL